MELTKKVREYIDKCVLCWLATSSSDNMPSVSPKECFTCYGPDSIIIANIASPQTVRNINQNENICISFIDIFIQKGFQVKGTAKIIDETHPEFTEMEKILKGMTGGTFPFATITKIALNQVKPILAPSYILFPGTTEEEQIIKAKKSYGLQVEEKGRNIL